jgi:endonuclease/exonuclease/phosphatase (EEP) superfamily protein YafD
MSQFDRPRSRILSVAAAWPFVLAGYLALRAIFGPVLWPLNWVEPLLLWLCLPSFVGLIVALVRRRRLRALAHAGISAVWLVLFGHLLAPNTPEPGQGPSLSVLTFNLGAGMASHTEISQLLRSAGADLVLLQELTRDEERALAADLLVEYPHRDLHGLGISGLGVLSKFPLHESELLQLKGRRPYQRSLIQVRGERTTVFNVHPGLLRLFVSPWSKDAADFEWLAQAALQSAPALIVGDFNATENMDLCLLLERAGLRDAFRESGRGLGLTFPTFGKYRGLPLPPLVRIDCVWHTQEYVAREARVLEDAGSDHLPLRVVLERR